MILYCHIIWIKIQNNKIFKEEKKRASSRNIGDVLQNRKQLIGCFPHDKLLPFPTVLKKAIIINTDDSSKTGDNWLGMEQLNDK